MPATFSIVARHKTHDQFYNRVAMLMSGTYPSGGFPVAASDVDVRTGIQTVLLENHAMWTGVYLGLNWTWMYPANWDADNSTIRLFRAPAGGGPLCELHTGDDVPGVTINFLVFAA